MSYYQVVCCLVSVILNGILIALILLKSPKSLGLYKHLLIYTSAFGAVYSLWDVLVEPVCICSEERMFFMRNHTNSIFSREVSFYILCIFCGFYGFSMGVFGAHFIYRYGAVETNFHTNYLANSKAYLLFIVPVVYSIFWVGLLLIFTHFDQESDQYLSEKFKENADFNIQNYSYIITRYYQIDKNGRFQFRFESLGILTYIWVVVTTSAFCVFYFGFKCYFKITNLLSHSSNISEVTKSLQKQLFQALVVQTLIPLMFMYVPSTIHFIFPMIHEDPSNMAGVLLYTIPIHLAIDPIPNMIIIKSYRNAIIEFFSVVFCVKRHRGSVEHEMTQTSGTPNV